MSIASIEDFQKRQEVIDVTLEGGLVVKVSKRPSLLKMVQTGKIPNPLLPVVSTLLGVRKPTAPKDPIEEIKAELKYNADVIEVYVIASLVEPSYEYVKDFLTDDDKVTIATVAQQGVQQVKNF
jgi:hypothetical protein